MKNKIPTIFSKFKADQKNRKKSKKEIDSLLTLSSTVDDNYTNKRVRLLDEGAIMYGDGTIRLYITKGAIQDFYDNLDSEYVGYISLAHAEMYQMPLSLGYWTKEDLHLETDQDGRTHLDVDLHLNQDLYTVKDILSQGIDLAVSADLMCGYDHETSYRLHTPIVNEINIPGFAIVGNPGNAESGGIRLNEGETMKLDEFKEKLSAVNQKIEPKEPEEKPEEKEELSEDVQAFIQEVMDSYEALATKYAEEKQRNEQLSAEIEALKEKKPEEKPKEKEEKLNEKSEEKEGEEVKEKLDTNPENPNEDYIRQFLASMGQLAAQGAPGTKPKEKPADQVIGL